MVGDYSGIAPFIPVQVTGGTGAFGVLRVTQMRPNPAMTPLQWARYYLDELVKNPSDTIITPAGDKISAGLLDAAQKAFSALPDSMDKYRLALQSYYFNLPGPVDWNGNPRDNFLVSYFHYLVNKGYVDGHKNPTELQAAIDQYNKTGEAPVKYYALFSGSYGLKPGQVSVATLNEAALQQARNAAPSGWMMSLGDFVEVAVPIILVAATAYVGAGAAGLIGGESAAGGAVVGGTTTGSATTVTTTVSSTLPTTVATTLPTTTGITLPVVGTVTAQQIGGAALTAYQLAQQQKARDTAAKQAEQAKAAAQVAQERAQAAQTAQAAAPSPASKFIPLALTALAALMFM